MSKLTSPLTLAERRRFYRNRNKEVLVDFDGTLCQWSYPDMGQPTPGARGAMKELKRMGLRVVVWTCRLSPEFNTEEERKEVMEDLHAWLKRNNIPYDEIDDGTNGKRLGCVWIDDKATNYSDNWGRTLRNVRHIVDLQRGRERGEDEEVLADRN